MKKKWFIGVIAALLLAAATAAAYWRLGVTGAEQVVYQTEPVRRRDLAATVQANGVIRARVGAEVKVGARISGRVETLFANIGDRVRKGQVIARLEQKDLEAKVNEARMNLLVGEANLALARKNLQRMENLFVQDLVSRDKVDVAERDHKAFQAQTQQMKETIRFNEAQRSYATIVAPIAGVIAAVTTQQGETVSATGLNVPTFVTIVDLNRLEVYAYVDETDIGKVRPGLDATFTVDSFPDKEFKGRVSAVYPKATIQDNVVYYITVISIENPEGLLKPDMTVTATFALHSKKGVLAVPNRAIRREGGRKVVQILVDGKALPREVKTGWKDGSYTEILAGVSEGEQLVSSATARTEKN